MTLVLRKAILSVSNRLLGFLSKGLVRCNVPSTSIVLEFSLIDKYSSIGEYTYINRFCEVTHAKIGNYYST